MQVFATVESPSQCCRVPCRNRSGTSTTSIIAPCGKSGLGGLGPASRNEGLFKQLWFDVVKIFKFQSFQAAVLAQPHNNNNNNTIRTLSFPSIDDLQFLANPDPFNVCLKCHTPSRSETETHSHQPLPSQSSVVVVVSSNISLNTHPWDFCVQPQRKGRILALAVGDNVFISA